MRPQMVDERLARDVVSVASRHQSPADVVLVLVPLLGVLSRALTLVVVERARVYRGVLKCHTALQVRTLSSYDSACVYTDVTRLYSRI